MVGDGPGFVVWMCVSVCGARWVQQTGLRRPWRDVDSIRRAPSYRRVADVPLPPLNRAEAVAGCRSAVRAEIRRSSRVRHGMLLPAGR